MSAVELARVQFAVTAGVHFLFVAVTLGLVTLVAILETRWVRTGNPIFERMTRFWGLLYVINYALGIATGLVMEFQFGLDWSGVGQVVGDVFGAPLTMETLVAFFLESTLLGLWIFGWRRLRPALHTALIWGVAATAYLSAFWVMVANSFLQHPVGYVLETGGRARLTDFGALLTNPALWYSLGHVLAAALLTGGCLMAGVSAWHVLRRTTEWEFFRRSLRLGVWTAFLAAVLTVGFGFAQFAYIQQHQPTKLADDKAAVQAQFVAAYGPGDYLPPALVKQSLGAMIGTGQLVFLFTLILLPLLFRDLLLRKRWLRPLLWLTVGLIPVPLILSVLGWVVREVGRQPWAVYGVLKTSAAASPLSPGAVTASLIGFSALIGALALADWWLIARYARRGPGDEFVADAVPESPQPTLSPVEVLT